MNAPAYVDPYLDLSLHGVRLIEASAGTGKTFTLATLVTRLVVEQRLRVGQVLAVTFTEAATQELRRRIRERLEGAARVAAGELDAGTPLSPEHALSRDIIERHLAGGGEPRARLANRLQQAALETDLASIFTIHGFCTRVLHEHALESGHAFAAPTLLTSDAALREELAADLWRALAASPDDALLLPDLWSSPAALKDDLRVLLGREPLRPAPPDVGEDPTPALGAAAADLRASFAAHGEGFRADLEAALQAKLLNAAGYKPAWIEARWNELRAWCATDGAGVLHDSFDRLTPDGLQARANKAGVGRTPQSPLCEAVAAFLAASARVDAWRQARAIALLHRVRTDARARLAELKRARRLQTFDDLIDDVADALDGAQGDTLVAALRMQYRFALVDEFQDTDPRQWAIFRRVFGVAHQGQPPALFLIGDPKQAIYGFRGGDVHTYLQAQEVAQHAPPLDRNFRSRPVLLEAIGRLYDAAGAAAFVDTRIRFLPVHAGGRRRDADFERNGAPAPALTVRTIARDPDDAQAAVPFNAERARALATRACVAELHALLADARAGRARLDGRALEPGDIAVLVRSHQEATRIQCALAAAGIPAVAAGRRSLFESDEARDLLALFEALVQPADDGRLRAALATVLLGLDAAAIAALDTDPLAHARHQRAAQDWRERWRRSGPFALVADLCAAAGPRLLALLDGERRLTNTLQLGEAMQDAQVLAPGLHAQLDWLRNAIAQADRDDEAQLLRLESDAQRVQIVTLHKSKGLQYPLVFLPFVGIGGKSRTPARHCVVRDGDARALQWKFGGAQAWDEACRDFAREQDAEDARLLYVGLTRAEHALWLASGPFYNAAKTRLASMLRDLGALHGQAGIVVDDTPLAAPPSPLPAQDEALAESARVARRALNGDWWVYSFTQLVKSEPAGRAGHAAATLVERGAEDESADAASGDARFGGSRFGNVLHDALEHADFGAWRGWRGGAAPVGEEAVLRAALAAGGYPGHELDPGLATLLPLVGHTLTTPLPEGGRLCDLPGDARRAEMEFHFPLHPTTTDRLIGLLHAHDILRERAGFGLRRRLEGLMTGKIDLSYVRNGRWHVLDYKSNRLPAYDRAAMAAAMAHSGYDLQALLYTLALHRWLRFRLGDDYDYARDFGGVRYLFCRGLVLGDGAGVYDWTPPPALLHALDALFSGQAAPEPA